jgi:DNA-binding transcriptional ArsR family regulator
MKKKVKIHLEKPENSYTRRSKVIKAMAHPSRLAMIDALAKGEKCVCELQEIVGSDITTVSKHLALMRKAGLVEDRKDGLWVYYRLRVPCILRFFDCIDAVLDSNKQPQTLEVCGQGGAEVCDSRKMGKLAHGNRK